MRTVVEHRPCGLKNVVVGSAASVLLVAALVLPACAAAPRGSATPRAGGAGAGTVPGALPGEWPQWRGPNRDGKSPETGLLKEWPKGGPPLAWKIKGVGVGYSSLAVMGGHVFTVG